MYVLDLFSGIGGFSLGLERAGMRTVAFCESDPFCREWLAQRWPGIPCYPDVRLLDGRTVGHVDVVCGGFPCQDISAAGNGAGLDGERSGLWFEMLRIVREVRPAWVLAENVTALRSRGADRVLGDLEESGYACWPFVVGADDVGAPHRRKRVWIIGRRMADADCDVLRQFEQRLSRGWPRAVRDEGEAFPGADGAADERVADTARDGDGRSSVVADRGSGRCEGKRIEDDGGLQLTPGYLTDRRGSSRTDDSRHSGSLWPAGPGEQQHEWEAPRTISHAECRLGASADGLSPRLGPPLNKARLKAAGNSVVPQIVEALGHAIRAIEQILQGG